MAAPKIGHATTQHVVVLTLTEILYLRILNERRHRLPSNLDQLLFVFGKSAKPCPDRIDLGSQLVQLEECCRSLFNAILSATSFVNCIDRGDPDDQRKDGQHTAAAVRRTPCRILAAATRKTTLLTASNGPGMPHRSLSPSASSGIGAQNAALSVAAAQHHRMMPTLLTRANRYITQPPPAITTHPANQSESRKDPNSHANEQAAARINSPTHQPRPDCKL